MREYPVLSKEDHEMKPQTVEASVLRVPLFIWSDAWGEFIVQVVKPVCQWLRASIDYVPANL